MEHVLMRQRPKAPRERAELRDTDSEKAVAFAVLALSRLEEPLQVLRVAWVGECAELAFDHGECHQRHLPNGAAPTARRGRPRDRSPRRCRRSRNARGFAPRRRSLVAYGRARDEPRRLTRIG